jgi:hypothetical protein
MRMANRRAGGQDLTVDDERFLERCKTQDALFPDIDLTWWSSVERPTSE